MQKVDYSFIKFPRVLIEGEQFRNISIEARTLLALILDRHGLSEINHDRFTDMNGEVYVIYTVEKVCDRFACGRTKALRLFRELESNGMITRKRTNGCKPSRIYLSQLFLNDLTQDFANSQNTTLQSIKNELCKVSESAVNKNNYSKNNFSNNNSSIIGFERTEEEIRDQIEYDCIVSDSNQKLVDEMVMIIFDVMNGTSPTVRIGRDEMPRGVVISRFCKLDSEHITSVLWQMEKNTSKIRNIKSYMITMLYDAPATAESEVSAEYAYQLNKNS